MCPRPIDKEPSGLPKHWTPEKDADPQWEGLVRLLRESDQPAMPTGAEYERIFSVVMEEVLGAEDASNRAQRRESFLDWLRLVLTGGGVPAHAFRMTAVAAVALVLGMNLKPAPEPSMAVDNQIAAPASATPDPDDWLLASRLDSAAGAAIRPVSASGDATPAPTVGRVVERDAWNFGGQPSHDWDWERTVASEPDWNFYQNTKSTGTALTVSSAPAQNMSSRQQVISLVQQMKFQSMVRRDEESLYQIRRLESALTPLLEGGQGVPQGEVAALDSFRRGEDLAARSRFADALLAFDDVRRRAPGTFQSFLAQFQIARIDFENLREYESALEAYRVALEEYPSHFLSDENKALILERIELLTRNSAGDWQALRIWQDALAAPDTAKQIAELERLLTASPSTPLAGQAALRLAGLTLEDIRGEQINPLYVVRLLDEAIAAAPASPHRAEIQFAKGEILLRRLLKLDEAAGEFREVVNNANSEQIRLLARQRLRYLEERQSRVTEH